MEKSAVTNFDLELNNHKEYAVVNKVYEQTLALAEKKVNEFFSKIERMKEMAISDCLESTKTQYKEYTQNFEEGVKSISESLETVNKEDNIEVKRLKRRTDDVMMLINDEVKIDRHFNDIIQRLERKLANLSIKQMQDPNYKFSLMGKFGNIYWKGTESSTFEVPTGGSSYKCYVSEELFEDELSFTVKIKKLNNPGSVNSHWNITFGLIKEGRETNQSSYYNDSCILHSNGYLNVKFSGSSGSELKGSIWKEEDEITVSRNSNDEVFFAMNKEEKVLCFTDIKGSMRAVIGFSSSLMGDVFEIVDCNKSFI